MTETGPTTDHILDSFNNAVLTIAGELDSQKILQLVVDTARSLVNAKYAALGVPDKKGSLKTFVPQRHGAGNSQSLPHYPRGPDCSGSLLTNRTSIRIPDIAADPRAAGFPSGHPEMSSFLGVPIVRAGEITRQSLPNRKNRRKFLH